MGSVARKNSAMLRLSQSLYLVTFLGLGAQAHEHMEIRARTGGRHFNATGDPVVIATSLPLDCCSKFSDYGRMMRQNYEIMIEWISENRGGVRLGGPNSSPRPLVVNIYNDYSDPELVEEIYNYLVDDLGHQILLSTYSSGLAKVAARIVNKTRAVMLAPCSASPSVFIGRPHIYSTITPSIKYLVGPFEATSRVARTVAYAFEPPSFTKSMCNVIPGIADSTGLEIIRPPFEISEDPTRDEVRHVLKSLQHEPPDVFIGCVYKKACMLFIEEMHQLKVNINSVLMSSCTTQEFGALGTRSKHIVGMSPWLPSFQIHSKVTNRTVLEFAEKYRDRYDEDPTYQGVSAQMSLLAFVEAIEAAQSIDPLQVSAKLREMRMDTIFGQISFDENGQGQNPFKGVQVVEGSDVRVVSPLDAAESKLVYPMPSWGERECLEVGGSSQKGLSENGTCVECSPGFVSVWNSSLRIRECIPCPAGTHPDFIYDDASQVTTQCVPCEAGRAGGSSALSECEFCPLGSFAATTGKTECLVCPPGRAAPELGALQCTPCTPGTAVNYTKATECSRCDIGRYMPNKNAATCMSCSAGLTTRSVGAIRPSECICPPGTYLVQSDIGSWRSCNACPKHMTCDIGALDPLLVTADSENGEEVYPLLKPGYWSPTAQPMVLYKCQNSKACPGGAPGSCGQKREGLVCAVCLQGYFQSGSECSKCSVVDESGLLYPWMPIVIGPMLILVKYFWSLDAPENWGSWQNACSSIFSILIRNCQLLGSVQKVQIDWPTLVSNGFLPWSYLFSLEDLFRPECMGLTFGDRLVIKLTGPLFVVGLFVLAFSVARASWWVGFMITKVSANVMFSMLMSFVLTFYVTIASNSLSLFACYEHPDPNDEMSLTMAPEILCFEGEWNQHVGLAMIAVATYVVALTAFLAYLCIQAPLRFSNPLFRQRYKFLFIKFRPDVWWWMLALMVQGLCMMISHVALSEPVMKYAWSMIVMLVYTTSSTVLQPWLHGHSNTLDAWGSGTVIFTVGLAFWYAGLSDTQASEVSDVFVVVVSFMPVFLACVIILKMACEGMTSVGIAKSDVTKKKAVACIQALLKNYSCLQDETVRGYANHLSDIDLRTLTMAHKLILSEHEGKQQSDKFFQQRLILKSSNYAESDTFQKVVCWQDAEALS